MLTDETTPHKRPLLTRVLEHAAGDVLGAVVIISGLTLLAGLGFIHRVSADQCVQLPIILTASIITPL
jgi:hypothetical protein